MAKVAHDINNPLAVVVANLEFLAELLSRLSVEADDSHHLPKEMQDWLSPHLGEAHVCLEDARQGADRIRKVIADMRTVAAREPSNDVATPPVATSGKPTLTADAFQPEPITTVTGIIRRTRVLVVDDQELVAKALQRCLREYDVVALVSAREALERLTSGERFDLILCDLMMPEMPGSALYEALRLLDPMQAERMVFVTGGATTAHGEAFLASVGCPVLRKPFEPSELRALVKSVLT